jgi:2-haloalkanoic acid dehalogenase type II
MKLTDYSALSFDCYGTLIDWESGIIESLSGLVKRVDRELTRNEILQMHAKFESGQQALTPDMLYRDVLAVVYSCLAKEWNVSVTDNDCIEYGLSVGNWDSFPDTVEALKYLKTRFRLFILSNVDNETFARSNKKLGIEFDGIFTAEDIGSYKPSKANFDYLIGRIEAAGIDRRELLHVAESLFHDHVPAKGIGLNTCLINRRHGLMGFGATMVPDSAPRFDFGFESLAEMVKALKGYGG